MKKIIRTVKVVLLLDILLFLLVFVFVMVRPSMGWDIYLIRGGSMKPALQSGELLLMKQTAVEKIRKGDIIVFQSGDRFLIHRVVDIRQRFRGEEGPWFQTKGDANPSPDHGLAYSRSGEFPKVLLYISHGELIIRLLKVVYMLLAFTTAAGAILLLLYPREKQIEVRPEG